MKLGRYTQNGSTATWSNIIQVALSAPTPTSTPVPTSTPTLTLAPTKTPTPTITITNTPTTTKAISKTLTPTPNKVSPTKNEEVLGDATIDNNDGVTKSIDKKEENTKPNINLLPIVFISIGIVFLLLCVIVILYPFIKGYINKKNEQ